MKTGPKKNFFFGNILFDYENRKKIQIFLLKFDGSRINHVKKNKYGDKIIKFGVFLELFI